MSEFSQTDQTTPAAVGRAAGGDDLAFAVVVCTRDRPDDLAASVASIAAAIGSEGLLVVVDASDAENARANASMLAAHPGLATRHVRFASPASAARQRNAGLDAVPDHVAIVHFLDDDVSVPSDYFSVLNRRLAADAEVGAVAAHLEEPGRPSDPGRPGWGRRLFLLDAARPGRVLASGATSSGQTRQSPEELDVEWLGGCSAFRLEAARMCRFDSTLQGYGRDGDLDFSFRVGRRHRMVVIPSTRIVHHVSPVNRNTIEAGAHDDLVHRYWFLEKNVRHPLRKPAFWWSVLGRLLASALSRHPGARDSLQGRLRAVRTILTRNHYLLQRHPDG